MKSSLRAPVALLALLAGAPFAFSAASCTKSGDAEALFTVPDSLDQLAGETFFDLPFPSDLRMENGKVRFKGWPTTRSLLLESYANYIDGKLDGFSPVGAGFVRFSGPLDPATLPADPAASIAEDASVFLVDVTPGSPDRGKKHPITVHFRAAEGVYWVPNTLSFMPAVGFPLRTHTTYALVVTDAVTADGGNPARASSALRQVLGVEGAATESRRAARDKFAPVVAELVDQGVDLGHVVQFTSFTTDDPTEEYLKAAAALPSQLGPPSAKAANWEVKQDGPVFDEYLGVYGPLPNFQDGKLPFASFGDGGNFKLDENGTPQVVDTFDARFSISVPDAAACPMPADGYPIVLYAHGTGGDYRSYVSDKTAKSLAGQCLASMGVDQIFHGTRPGAPADETEIEILFFNFNNIEAARTNVRQSGLDEMQRARLFTETHMTIPASISKTGAEIKFDASKLMFFGHSQGSLNGPLFLAASADVRGAVLSGASGLMSITLLEKTEPQPSVAGLVKGIFLGLSDEEGLELAIDHPAISLAQSIVDTVDPINYAHLALNPVVGVPKSVYQTEGIRADGSGDSFAPPRGGEALAMAFGIPLMDPFVRLPPDAAWENVAPTAIPAEGLSGNVAGGLATGVLAQFDPGKGEGHFVVFNVAAATNQSAGFLRALADDPHGRVPAL